MTQEEKDMKACEIAIRNSYLKCLYGDKQLAYTFFLGMKYGNSGELPKDLLDDNEFVNGKMYSHD